MKILQYITNYINEIRDIPSNYFTAGNNQNVEFIEQSKVREDDKRNIKTYQVLTGNGKGNTIYTELPERATDIRRAATSDAGSR